MRSPGFQLDLARERLPESSAASIRRFLFATLLALFAVNLSADSYLTRFPVNEANWLIGAKWELLTSQMAAVDWLIVGDSSCNQGIDANWLAEQWGATVINACALAYLVLADDVLKIEAHIERWGPPRKVIVAHTYDIWDQEMNVAALAHTPLPWGYWREREIDRLTTAELWQVFLTRYLPLVAENRSVAQLITVESRYRPLFLPRFEMSPSGYLPRGDNAAVLAEAEAAALGDIAILAQLQFNISNINERMLIRLGALANAHQVDIYLVNAPVSELIAASAAYERYSADRDRYLAGWAATSPYLHYLQFDPAVPLVWMIDDDHTVRSGAELYTRRLAAALP